MKREHMPFKYMGQFKAVAADYEYYLSLSNEPRAVCLTERQMYIMQVWNTYTPWMTRWYNTEDTSEAELRSIAAEIESILMCSCGIPEPSITDRFNSTTYITNTSNSYTETYNTWNTSGQTVSSIAPDLDYDTGDPGNITKAQCLAIEMILDAIIEAAKANKQQLDQPNRDMVKNLGNTLGALGAAGGAAIGVGGAAAAFVGFLGGPYLVLGLALAAVGLGIANLIWTTDLSVFMDEEARQAVLCCMWDNMNGQTLTRDRFQGGVSCGDLTGNAATLATIVQAYLDDLDTYLNFLVTTQGIYEVADFGVLPECGCGEDQDFHLINYPGSPSDCTFTFISRTFGVETWEIEMNTLPNTYWYMSCVDEDSKPYTLVDAEMITGTFNQWSAVRYPSGGFSSFTFNDAIGLDFYILDFYGNPGTPCKLRIKIELPEA